MASKYYRYMMLPEVPKGKPLDKALAIYWGNHLHCLKQRRKQSQRACSKDKNDQRARREVLKIEVEIDTLVNALNAIKWLTEHAGVAQTAEQPPCKRQVDGSIPVHWHQNTILMIKS